MHSVAWCFDNGRGVAKDKTRAFEWYLKAAENGNVDAMNQCYLVL